MHNNHLIGAGEGIGTGKMVQFFISDTTGEYGAIAVEESGVDGSHKDAGVRKKEGVRILIPD